MLVDAVRLVDLDVGQAGGREGILELVSRQRTGDAARPFLHIHTGGLVHVRVGDHVGDREASAGLQHAGDFSEHLALVGREVDHAIRDHDIDGPVGQRNVLDVALDELDVADTGRGCIRARKLQHLVRHVEANRLARSVQLAGPRSARRRRHPSRDRAPSHHRGGPRPPSARRTRARPRPPSAPTAPHRRRGSCRRPPSRSYRSCSCPGRCRRPTRSSPSPWRRSLRSQQRRSAPAPSRAPRPSPRRLPCRPRSHMPPAAAVPQQASFSLGSQHVSCAAGEQQVVSGLSSAMQTVPPGLRG